ncbi:MAG: hypothetical protein AB8H86_10130 [Polyangiales bacterium]
MSKVSLGHLSATDAGEGQANMPKAIAGAFAGALAIGVVYGVVGRVIGEYSYIAFLIGGAAGLGAMKLGGARSMTVGAIAAFASIVAVLLAKVIVGAPEGTSWIAYHTTMFDILFCYLAPPAAAFFAAGSDKVRELTKHLPF